MDEVREFCRRVLGSGPCAHAAYERAVQGSDRLERLMLAARACGELAADSQDVTEAPACERDADATLAAAVAREISAANARLPERQRQVLALRELLRLSYTQITQVTTIETAAVPSVLARARLRLRSELRSVALPDSGSCAQFDRALRVISRRQDSEPLSSEDDRWLPDHLRECPHCSRAHAAMLEASTCYRSWAAPARVRRRAAANGASLSATPEGRVATSRR